MLSGAIPAALGDLASLQILYLAQNELSGAIPAALGDLASLQHPGSRYQNGLSGAIPAELGDLTNLRAAVSLPEYVERGDPGRRWGI